MRAVDIRASDEDRQRVVAELEKHTGAGRLTLDEFAARVEAACGARTLDELTAVTSDLPAPAAAQDDQPRRELLLIFGVAVVALMLLVALMALRS